jgi:hypothetical protein
VSSDLSDYKAPTDRGRGAVTTVSLTADDMAKLARQAQRAKDK